MTDKNQKKMERPSAPDVVPLRPRVLVVDDDPAIGTFLASRLRKLGVDTLYAANAVQAYRIASRERPSVIISDYDMPDGDARYLLTKLRSSPATALIPVIVLSGCDIDEQTEQNLMREIMGHAGATQVSCSTRNHHSGGIFRISMRRVLVIGPVRH